MSWVRIDDGFPDHPKVRRAGPDAGWMFVAGLCYCARYLTDGEIPREVVPTLTALRRPVAAVRALLTVGLWVETPGGYVVPDYLEFNPSKADIEGRRDAALVRMQFNRDSDDVRANESGTESEVHSPPTPTPTPKKKRAKGEDRYAEDFDAVWHGYPKKLARQDAFRAYSARRKDGIPAEDLALAAKHYAEECAREGRELKFVMHGATFFGPRERWRDYLAGPPASSGAVINEYRL